MGKKAGLPHASHAFSSTTVIPTKIHVGVNRPAMTVDARFPLSGVAWGGRDSEGFD